MNDFLLAFLGIVLLFAGPWLGSLAYKILDDRIQDYVWDGAMLATGLLVMFLCWMFAFACFVAASPEAVS